LDNNNPEMRYIILAIFVFFIINLSAQEDDIKLHSFGVALGINGCIPGETNTSSGLGYSVAFDYSYNISDKLYFHSGLCLSNYFYSQKMIYFPTNYETLNFIYIDIPFELSYRPKRFMINAGLSKSILTDTGVGVNFSTGYTFKKNKTHKDITLILPAVKFITDIADINSETYLILETKIIFSL